MPLPVAHLALPTELLFNVLSHVLAHSVHMVVVSPHDVEWHLRAHHTLSAVCFPSARSCGTSRPRRSSSRGRTRRGVYLAIHPLLPLTAR
ncbi:hypothetical protein B0H17DRAFT_1103936, partial [Mycena rosella]